MEENMKVVNDVLTGKAGVNQSLITKMSVRNLFKMSDAVKQYKHGSDYQMWWLLFSCYLIVTVLCYSARMASV